MSPSETSTAQPGGGFNVTLATFLCFLGRKLDFSLILKQKKGNLDDFLLSATTHSCFYSHLALNFISADGSFPVLMFTPRPLLPGRDGVVGSLV